MVRKVTGMIGNNEFEPIVDHCGPRHTDNRIEAERYFAKAAELGRSSGWLTILSMTLHHWGRSLAEQRRFDEAEDRFSEALAIRIQIGEPRQEKSRHALKVLADLRRRAE